MSHNIVFIPEATSLEHSAALAEVSHFGCTDMGFGHTKWPYRILEEPELSMELARLANAHSDGACDTVTFQPCPPDIAHNQDRYITTTWDLAGGQWFFNAVLDGHLNSDAAQYAMEALPDIVKSSLMSLTESQGYNPAQVSTLLHDSVVRLDELICSQFLKLFPNDPVSLDSAQIQQVFQSNRGCASIALRCLGGTTLLLSLTDPLKENLWIANLSDSYAVFGFLCDERWSPVQMNNIHAANNPAEADRIRSEHPHEPEVIEDGRVLGFLEPTRAIGDIWMKLPAVYSRIFQELDQEAISAEMLEEVSQRICSPPYVSNMPDVVHQSLPLSSCFLILATDGLRTAEPYVKMSNVQVLDRWVALVGHSLRSGAPCNSAMMLLRDALGGPDRDSVSRHMTVEMDERWMDDVTIIVQKIR